ncbi:MAG: ATP-binding protein [bacterium]|nr:ATP-binding protein [bacterium]
MTVGEIELQQGFEQFVAAATELERGYRELKARVAAFDEERESIFAALPIGLIAVRGETRTICNREGERLCALASEHGIELSHQRDGEVPIGGGPVGKGLVRVRRVALPEGELVMLEDRSHVQELEREVGRLDRLAGLSELALGIAHEIKNPLNGVLGFADLIERTDDPETTKRYAGKVVAGVRQVDAIVKSLLGFARPERDRARLSTVRAIAAEAIAAAGIAAAAVTIEGDLDTRADAEALVRVLANLLRNSAESRADVSVAITVTQRAGWLEITVADDGPGVSAELGERALEPLVSTKASGTGLGLSLSTRVLAFLGGDLRLLNPGVPGARFLVRVPLAENA